MNWYWRIFFPFVGSKATSTIMHSKLLSEVQRIIRGLYIRVSPNNNIVQSGNLAEDFQTYHNIGWFRVWWHARERQAKYKKWNTTSSAHFCLSVKKLVPRRIGGFQCLICEEYIHVSCSKPRLTPFDVRCRETSFIFEIYHFKIVLLQKYQQLLPLSVQVIRFSFHKIHHIGIDFPKIGHR